MNCQFSTHYHNILIRLECWNGIHPRCRHWFLKPENASTTVIWVIALGHSRIWAPETLDDYQPSNFLILQNSSCLSHICLWMNCDIFPFTLRVCFDLLGLAHSTQAHTCFGRKSWGAEQQFSRWLVLLVFTVPLQRSFVFSQRCFPRPCDPNVDEQAQKRHDRHRKWEDGWISQFHLFMIIFWFWIIYWRCVCVFVLHTLPSSVVPS